MCNPLKITLPKEFSFQENLRYLQRNDKECMFEVYGEVVRKVIPIPPSFPLVEISCQEQLLNVQILYSTVPCSSKDYEAIIHYIREWFDLDTDLLPFYQMAKKDSLLCSAVQDYYGLRTIGIPDLFEAISWGILGQQINLSLAYTLKKNLVEKYGNCVTWNNRHYWLFPDASTIANLSIEDLMPLKLTTKKCEYLLLAAQLISTGEISKNTLKQMVSLKKAEQQLTSIRGIGPWTANYVLMRCLRYPDAFPIADVGLHNAIKFITKADCKPTKEEILDYAKDWRGFESYATFYLWRYLY
ncbi:DNA-3-methyladenine glycosylase family protein [Rummeliibacillus sp. NPDC094406]|uniref:DNA-3-methyladenine glycosylase family protein n=1 Tax=Rummeliibacillus sp. NPDC094406 TaxID=3364511 RepID=UPI003806443E